MDTNPPSQPQYPQYPEQTQPPYQPQNPPPPYEIPAVQPPYPYPTPQYPQTPYPQPPYQAPPTQPPYPQPQYPQPSQPLYPQTQYPQQPYPYSQPLSQPPAQPPRKSRRTLWIVGGSVVGLLILCCTGFGIAAAIGNNASGNSTTSSTATPQQPTVTPNPNATSNAYIAAVLPEMSTMNSDFTQIQTDCGADNFSACSSDNQKAHDDATDFQNILNQNPAPPCLKSADTQLRDALTDIQNGANLIVQGINNDDVSQVTSGTTDYSQATTAFDQATTDVNQAQC